MLIEQASKIRWATNTTSSIEGDYLGWSNWNIPWIWTGIQSTRCTPPVFIRYSNGQFTRFGDYAGVNHKYRDHNFILREDHMWDPRKVLIKLRFFEKSLIVCSQCVRQHDIFISTDRFVYFLTIFGVSFSFYFRQILHINAPNMYNFKSYTFIHMMQTI